jgi:low temperature requirement protein LtrA
MPLLSSLRTLYRDRAAANGNRVASVELFFDLIFVFAVTQLSHLLLSHFTLTGAAQTALLLLAVWWVWVYTSWTTNWLDPDKGPVRWMMFALTGLGLVMSTAIPDAFEPGAAGLIFAGSYVAMQIGRTVFMTLCAYAHGRNHFLNFSRVLIWLAVAAGLWIAGVLEPAWRLPLWAVALAFDYGAPLAMFYVPGLGPSQMADWDVDGGHMAERCGLFIMIALGETIVEIGESLAGRPIDTATAAAFGIGFVTCVALWWMYFGLTAEKGARAITRDALPGRLARTAYTYLHILLAAGIILTAVGTERVLSGAHLPTASGLKLSVLGGPALYLAGNGLFIHAVSGHVARLHVAGIVVLAGLAAWPGFDASPLVVAAIAAATLIGVATFEPMLYRFRQRQAVAADA